MKHYQNTFDIAKLYPNAPLGFDPNPPSNGPRSFAPAYNNNNYGHASAASPADPMLSPQGPAGAEHGLVAYNNNNNLNTNYPNNPDVDAHVFTLLLKVPLNSKPRLVLAHAGFAFVTCEDTFVRKIDMRKGKQVYSWKAVSGVCPYGIAIQNDSLFICHPDTRDNRGTIGEYKLRGEVPEFYKATGFAMDVKGQRVAPCGIAAHHNRLFVTDLLGHRVVVYGFDLKSADNRQCVATWGAPGSDTGQFNSPRGVTVSGSRMYVCDNGNRRVQVFDLNGNHTCTLESPGEALHPYSPTDVLVDDERIYITDDNNHRILVFGLNGRFIRHFRTSTQQSRGLTNPNNPNNSIYPNNVNKTN